jgi:hypothetical protein
MSERRARVMNSDRGEELAHRIRAYLPRNYRLEHRLTDDEMIIVGTDSAGWTLDGYVIPRLASGLIFAEEITDE